MGNGSDLHIVENLHISLRHLHTDVILGLLQIGRHRLQVQPVHLDILWYLETREERHARGQLEAGIRGVLVLIDIVRCQTAPEVEVLSHRSVQVRQSAVAGGGEGVRLPLDSLLLLFDRDVMRHSIILTLAERPQSVLCIQRHEGEET